jgi:hypothetical protein
LALVAVSAQQAVQVALHVLTQVVQCQRQEVVAQVVDLEMNLVEVPAQLQELYLLLLQVKKVFVDPH